MSYWHVRKRYLLLLLFFVAGCGADETSVDGKVTYAGAPLPDAEVVFYPMALEGSPFGGRSGADGAFHLQPGADGKGPPPGPYRVVVTRYLMAGGKTPPHEEIEMLRQEGKVRNVLPPIYSDPARTPLKAEIVQGENTVPVTIPR